MTPLLEARGIAIDKRLRPTDLRIDGPALVALIGPNGGGKTSLLRGLAGVEDAGGEVRIDGEALAAAPPARRSKLVSFLPASRDLAWPIAARDVIALGVSAPDEARIDELLDRLELRSLAHRPVTHLSTGERTRVLLARALAARPKLLLLDEPLANLDPYWVLKMLEIFRSAVSSDQSAAILSLHDLSQVDAFDRLLLIDQGRLVADGQPSSVIRSDTLSDAFRVVRDGIAWRIRPLADPRSSQ